MEDVLAVDGGDRAAQAARAAQQLAACAQARGELGDLPVH
jgi:hypothetical protein